MDGDAHMEIRLPVGVITEYYIVVNAQPGVMHMLGRIFYMEDAQVALMICAMEEDLYVKAIFGTVVIMMRKEASAVVTVYVITPPSRRIAGEEDGVRVMVVVTQDAVIAPLMNDNM